MTRRVRALAVAVFAIGALELSGCVPPAADYTESDWPKNLRLDPAPAQLTIDFTPASSRILPSDLARLRAIAASGGLVPSDQIAVTVAGPPALATARFESIAASLLPYGIVPHRVALVLASPNRAVIRRERYVVTLPKCPDWSKPAAGAGDFANTVSSNFGCADKVNLGLIAATPADLAAPRRLGSTAGQPAASAVERYLTDKVVLPAAALVGPIAVPATQASPAPGAGAGGSGAPGAQP